MFQRDYILRMIEQFSKVLAKILFNKETKNFEHALDEIKKSYKTVFGIDWELVSASSAEEILNLLKLRGKSKQEVVIMIAELIMEEAELHRTTGINLESLLPQYQKALFLFLDAIIMNKNYQTKEYFAKAEFIIGVIKNFNSKKELMIKTFKYYELSGSYSKAENILFDLANMIPSEIYEAGTRFYNNLKSKSDDELSRGDFSRKEIDQGLSAFIELINKS